MDEMSMSEALTAQKIAVVQAGFPQATMEADRLIAVQSSIMEAYEGIPIEGPQVRFAKCTHRPGYLLVTCADATSAEWLKNITPTLQPWEGASLRALAGNDVPGIYACTVYVPDESNLRLEAERILTRLRVSNKGLHTNLWTVFAKTPSDKGQVWTFSMDKQSMEELKKLDMRPYFGMGRIKFRPKEQGSKHAGGVAVGEEAQKLPQEEEQPSEGRNLVPVVHVEENPPQEGGSSGHSGKSPLKRHIAQEGRTPMEVGEATGEEEGTSSRP